MLDISKYIFLCLYGNDNELNKSNYFGIQKIPNLYDHNSYFTTFLETNSLFPFNVDLNGDYSTICERIATDGKMIIVNSAPEYQKKEDLFFCYYLPSNPTLQFFLTLLEFYPELTNYSFFCYIYGQNSQEFLNYYNQKHDEKTRKYSFEFFNDYLYFFSQQFNLNEHGFILKLKI